jgi:hypothetical protein
LPPIFSCIPGLFFGFKTKPACIYRIVTATHAKNRLSRRFGRVKRSSQISSVNSRGVFFPTGEMSPRLNKEKIFLIFSFANFGEILHQWRIFAPISNLKFNCFALQNVVY